jgi:CRISPR/Cas system CSM-associated protein Csm3 (group 7 of RAMP superfamily)
MTRLTIFTATLVQDSALSVSGTDRESVSDQPFAMVGGTPLLSGRGLKGAAVAMARRFFEPLPRSISKDPQEPTAPRRSAWHFANARPAENAGLQLRSGVGIRQRTGARAEGVLFDHEVVCAGTRWNLELRVDWRLAGAEAEEAEGILGYVLSQHWLDGRCWLGGGVARGLGWCHLEDLSARRLDAAAYETWVTSGRSRLPAPEVRIPTVEPTRSWCFRTRDVTLRFGEYRPGPEEGPWGLDMLAIGPHDSERSAQSCANGTWAQPSWVAEPSALEELLTDRALLMEGGVPLLPGGSVRGPLRHAFSRRARARGQEVADPHPAEGKVGDDDPAGKIFGTVAKSSSVLVRDARAEPGWTAARLHMHAEDELSAGSYGSSKRDAVRVLSGAFPVRIVVEGAADGTVRALMEPIDRLVALGALGHLPVGGHKTRGAGWCRWEPGDWIEDDVVATRSWQPEAEAPVATEQPSQPESRADRERPEERVCVLVVEGCLDETDLTLGRAAEHARDALRDTRALWWCEPAIDFAVTSAPATFGRDWPEGSDLRIDEVAFFAPDGVWRAARTTRGWWVVHVREVPAGTRGAEPAAGVETPARLHGDTTRFSAKLSEPGGLLVREWRSRDQIIGFTLIEGRNDGSAEIE